MPGYKLIQHYIRLNIFFIAIKMLALIIIYNIYDVHGKKIWQLFRVWHRNGCDYVIGFRATQISSLHMIIQCTQSCMVNYVSYILTRGWHARVYECVAAQNPLRNSARVCGDVFTSAQHTNATAVACKVYLFKLHSPDKKARAWCWPRPVASVFVSQTYNICAHICCRLLAFFS